MGQPLLLEDNIVAGLEARSREDALRKIVDALPSSALRGVEKNKILKLLVLREQVGTTAIGQGIALPHCFSPEVLNPIISFAVSPQGVPFSSLDGDLVHFIFILILPLKEDAERQKRYILQNIKWVLCDRYMQERLKAASSVAEIHKLIAPERQFASLVEI